MSESLMSQEEIARPLAEHLAPDFARAAVRMYETRRTPAGLFHSAWSQLEYAMSTAQSAEDREAHFDTTLLLTGELLNRNDVHQDIRLGAFIVASYLPLFKKRSVEEAITVEDCDEVYKSVGASLRYLRPLEIDEPPQWRMTEAAVLALSARIGRPELLLYPASPREEHSSNFAYNHDSYFFFEEEKLPLQQKLLPTNKEYDETVTVLTLDPIMKKAAKAAGVIEGAETLAGRTNYLLSLIIAESGGYDMRRSEVKYLNFITQAIAAHNVSLQGQERAIL